MCPLQDEDLEKMKQQIQGHGDRGGVGGSTPPPIILSAKKLVKQ